jgi:hypothetical protein
VSTKLDEAAAKLNGKFPLGHVMGTQGALTLDPVSVGRAMLRFVQGDWGNVPSEDAEANADALVHGERVMGSYYDSAGVEFWIITEADRSATTVLLPEEY